MNSIKIMGIDVGFNGGIAEISSVGIDRDCGYSRMPIIKTDIGIELDYKRIYNMMKNVDIIYVEKAQPMPKNGVRQSFKYGGGFYAIRCMATLLNKRVTYVSSQTWKKVILKDMNKSKKESSVTRCKQLFPCVELKFGKSTKDNDGVAEALLIASYGRQIEIGGKE